MNVEVKKGKGKERKKKRVYLYFCRITVPKNKKRRLMSYEGVNFPCLPNVKEVNAILTKNMVESLQHNPLTSPQEYDIEAAEILDGGKLYIGMNDYSYFLFSIILIYFV